MLTLLRKCLLFGTLAVLPAYAQFTEIPSGGGGGASAANDLTDVTITGVAEDDVLVKSSGDWVNTPLLTAIGGAGLTNERVPYTASGALTDSTRLQYDGGRMLLTSDGSSAPLQFTGSNTSGLRMIDSTNLGAGTSGMRFQYAAGGSAQYGDSNITGIIGTSKRVVIQQNGTAEYSQPNIQFWVTAPHTDSAYVFMKGAGVNPLVRINASAFTMRVMDETATTGDTKSIVKEGAGQASAPFQVVDNSDGAMVSVAAGGGLVVHDAGTQPTCDSSTRFMIWSDAGGAGVKDAVEVCAKDSGDSYAWRTIY